MDAETANREARAAVGAGAEEIAFSSALVEGLADLDELLANLDEISIHFEVADEGLVRLLLEKLRAGRRAARVSAGCDALASVDFAAEVIKCAPDGFVPFTIHGDAFEEAGATAAEEVGFTLAAGVDFLGAMQERGADAGRAAAALEFSFAMGSNYFFQIAKLRAFRMMWARAVESFGGARAEARAHIAARTSRWNKTLYDPHVNILRATTEAMAAVLGGADSVMVAPFDSLLQTARRGKPQAGAEYAAPAEARGVDGARSRCCRRIVCTWRHLQIFWRARAGRSCRRSKLAAATERRRNDGMIAAMLERSMAAREKAVALRRRVFVGTNQFANPAEQALDRCEAGRICETERGAHPYEELRLRTERPIAAAGPRPQRAAGGVWGCEAARGAVKFRGELFCLRGI